MHRLDPISYEEMSEMEEFNQEANKAGASEVAEENQYIILTKKDNLVHNGEFLSDSPSESGFSYYLIAGKPEITLKFPINEMIIILILIFILVVILFKRSPEEISEDYSRKLRKDIEKQITYSRREEL